ncbi:MAG TPA: alpha/beta hydrolase [Eoetvoesiella sp.]
MDIILIHGAWHGGWCWGRVRERLERLGHQVYAPTLTGLGEQAHRLSPEVGVLEHIEDIGALLCHQNVHDAVIVGHSYAGLVIPGVLQNLGQDVESPSIKHAIYLDGVVVRQGQCWADAHSMPDREARLASGLKGHGGAMVFPVPSVARMGVSTQADITWADAQLTPHPARTYTDTVLASADDNQVPRTYIDCVNPPLPGLLGSKQLVREWGWPVVELQSGHDCMISHPDETVAAILRCLET